MTDKLIIAGFGGQGIITAGEVLAWIAMSFDMKVTHYPSYGAEMRGGTANCTVVISDEEIFSPVVSHPDSVLVMNEPSLKKFMPVVVKDGSLIYDSTLVKVQNERKDIKIVSFPVTQEADRLGNSKVANMILLGLFLKIKKLFDPEKVVNAIEKFFTSKNKKNLIPLNIKAFEIGYKSF